MTVDPAFGALVAAPIILLAVACAFSVPFDRRRLGIVTAGCALGFVVGCGHSGNDTSGTSAPSSPGVVATAAGPPAPTPQPLTGAETKKALSATRNEGTIAVDVLDDHGTGMRNDVTLSIPRSGTAYVLGWAFDEGSGTPCSAVAVVVDGRRAFPTQYAIPRPDVAAHFNKPNVANVGYAATLTGAALGSGTHDAHVTCLAAKATARGVKNLTITVQ
jgi:hypothetical protein